MIKSKNGIVQICHIVSNVDAAVDEWINTLGAGPFFCERNLTVPVKYHGKDTHIDIHVALGNCGDLQIELIEIASDIPSIYREVYPDGGTGFHHVAVFADDYDAHLKSLQAGGGIIAAEGVFNGDRFAYVDTRSTVGFYTEVYENGPGLQLMYRNIAEAARNWDGKDPKRSLLAILG